MRIDDDAQGDRDAFVDTRFESIHARLPCPLFQVRSGYRESVESGGAIPWRELRYALPRHQLRSPRTTGDTPAAGLLSSRSHWLER